MTKRVPLSAHVAAQLHDVAFQDRCVDAGTSRELDFLDIRQSERGELGYAGMAVTLCLPAGNHDFVGRQAAGQIVWQFRPQFEQKADRFRLRMAMLSGEVG